MLPRRYATNHEVIAFFARHGLTVTDLKIKGGFRHLKCRGVDVALPMPMSADDCLALVREKTGEGDVSGAERDVRGA